MTLLFGVSKFFFTAHGAGGGCCSVRFLHHRHDRRPVVLLRYLKLDHPEGFRRTHAGEARTLEGGKTGFAARFNAAFNGHLRTCWLSYEVLVHKVLRRPARVLIAFGIVFVCSLRLVWSARLLLLSPNRRRPVRDQPQGAVRNQAAR